MAAKKVTLVLVEGISDKMALERIMQAIVTETQVLFYIVDGDLTVEYGTDPSHILNKITEKIKEFISETKVTKADIVQVIHLVDLDGTYIEDSHIQKGTERGFVYDDDCIKAHNLGQVKERNHLKASVLDKLITTNHVYDLPYRIYFMSCDLDHVLYNERNLDGRREKFDKAVQFSDGFRGKEEEFIDFLSQEGVLVPGDYKESWHYAKEEVHSLGRGSNFHLYFEEK